MTICLSWECVYTNTVLQTIEVVTRKSSIELFKRLHEDEFLKQLDEIPWDTAFIFEDFNDAINTHVPLINKLVKKESPPKWLTSKLHDLIISRDEKLKNAKLFNTEKD